MLIKKSRVMQLHAIIQIIGVVAQAHYIAKFLRQMWEIDHYIYGLVSWAGRSTPPKIEIMLEYGLLLTFVAVVILALSTYDQRNKEYIKISSLRWVTLVAYELICLLFSFSAFWVVLAVLLPAWLYSRNLPPRSVVAENASLLLAFGALFGILLALSATSWSPDVQVSNEYSDFTEYTRLMDGRLVNNTEYLIANSVRVTDNSKACKLELADEVVHCLSLSRNVFPNAQATFLLFPPSLGIAYNWEKEILIIRKKDLTDKEYQLIESLWGVHPSILEPRFSWDRSTEMEYFRSINRSLPEYGMSSFDEHSGLYIPALAAIFLKAPASTAPYAFGLTKTMGGLLSITDTPTYNDYYIIYWWAIYAYLLLLTIVAWRLTRNAWAAVIVLAVATYAKLVAGLEALELNSIIHFPDLICLMIIAYDIRKSTISSAFIRASAIGFMIWWNYEFGLSLLVASITWHLLEGSSANGYWRRILPKLVLESLIAAIVIFSLIKMSNNQDVFSSPATHWWQASILASLICLLIWARFMSNYPASRQDPSLDAAGIWTLYSVPVIVFVMPATASNATAMLFFAALPATIFFIWFIDKRGGDRVAATRFISYIASVSIVILAAVLATSQLHYRKSLHVNKNHKIFAWNFSGLSATSTADPEIMQRSVNLIEKYQPEGRLQIISKYENLLRILIGRPDYITHIKWGTYAVSHESINNSIARIIQANAPILFVERKLLKADKIEMNHSKSVIELSISQVLGGLSRCYTPGEIGGLLQVWHRSCETK